MTRRKSADLEQRVARAAQAALDDHGYVSAIDVLTGVGWLDHSALQRWRQGRADSLEQVTQAGLGKISTAMAHLRRWARAHDLTPSETGYVARTRDRRPLQFSVSGSPAIEQAYRTHWVSPVLSERKRRRLAEQHNKPPDLVVIQPLKDFTCDRCGQPDSLLMMVEEDAVCMTCADLDHLVYLPRGDAALTRRAHASSGLSAVVVRFSRTRKRYERQGLLVEEPALAQAERACLPDAEADARAAQREQDRLGR